MNITSKCNHQTYSTSHTKTANKKVDKMSLAGQKRTGRFNNLALTLLNNLLVSYGWSHKPTKFIFKDLMSE